MSNDTVSAVLGFILLLSAVSVTSISDVYAKTEPAARPDVQVHISIIQGEPQLEDGKVVYGGPYMTEEKFPIFYDDLDKADRIFDMVMLPILNDFVDVHRKEIANKYTDRVQISYSPQNDVMVIVFSQIPQGFAKQITMEPQFSDSLKMIGMISVEFPVSARFYDEQSYANWLRDILPNTSARVGYLTNDMQKTLEKHENEIINKLMHGISSFMLDDMSKTTIYSSARRIVEYNAGIHLVLANPVSVYSVPEFSTNTPISFVKSSNYPLKVSCSSRDGDITKMTSTLTYPNGEESSTSSRVVRNPHYTRIEVALKATEPEGLYKLVLNDSEPKKLIYCHMDVNRGSGQDHLFEYVDLVQSQEAILDGGWTAYRPESWCNYSRLMSVESPDATIFEERSGTWVTIYEWLNQFGEFEATSSNVHFDNEDRTYFLHAIKWRGTDSPRQETGSAMQAFNSLSSDMKKGRELSLYLIRGDCINAEGKEFGVETETSYIIEEIKFIQQEKKISYVVDTGETTRGLFEVTIPKELLNGDFTVMVDGKPHYVTESVASSVDDTNTTLTYWHEGSATNIEVIGTEAIPEFPTVLTILVSSIVGSTVISRLFLSRGR